MILLVVTREPEAHRAGNQSSSGWQLVVFAHSIESRGYFEYEDVVGAALIGFWLAGGTANNQSKALLNLCIMGSHMVRVNMAVDNPTPWHRQPSYSWLWPIGIGIMSVYVRLRAPEWYIGDHREDGYNHKHQWP